MARQFKKHYLFCVLVLLALYIFYNIVIIQGIINGGFIAYVLAMIREMLLLQYDEAHVFYNVCFSADQPVLPKLPHPQSHDLYYYHLYAYSNPETVITDTRHNYGNKYLNIKYRHVSHDEHIGYFRIHVKDLKSEENRNFRNEIVIIPTVLNTNTYYNFIFVYIPSLFGLLRWAQDNGYASKEEISNSILFQPLKHTVATDETFKPLFDALGPSEMQPISQTDDGICFKRAIFGRKRSYSTFAELGNYLSNAWQISPDNCLPNEVTIIQRDKKNFRSLINAEEIRNVVQNLGYVNTKIVVMENLPLVEQVRVTRCTRIYIAVQGAGLTWFVFLPQNAIVIEITYNNWPVFFIPRINYHRPDITTRHFQCQGHVSDEAYSYFVKMYLKYTGPLTQEVKDLAIAESKKIYRERFYPFATPMTIWKISDCFCDLRLFKVLRIQ